ncbi:hypothetical protein SDC9_140362 [bioreactor metagenome]|uniref:Uncharacterized protein n=1 Tax=bioreactor metagenome TaxID=1076179 RepID=A0A645DV45_9ZZZZ
MTEGMKDMKKRMNMIAKRPQTKVITMVLIAAIYLGLVGCTYGNAMIQDESDENIVSTKKEDNLNEAEWKKAYIEYLSSQSYFSEKEEEVGYTFYFQELYLDEDNIPELYCRYYAGGSPFLIYYDKLHESVKEEELGGYIEYIEHEGLFDMRGMLTVGTDVDQIYKFENNNITLIASGYRGFNTENGVTTWENEQVSEEEYMKQLNGVFDTNKKSEMGKEKNIEELIMFIREL